MSSSTRILITSSALLVLSVEFKCTWVMLSAICTRSAHISPQQCPAKINNAFCKAGLRCGWRIRSARSLAVTWSGLVVTELELVSHSRSSQIWHQFGNQDNLHNMQSQTLTNSKTRGWVASSFNLKSAANPTHELQGGPFATCFAPRRLKNSFQSFNTSTTSPIILGCQNSSTKLFSFGADSASATSKSIWGRCYMT